MSTHIKATLEMLIPKDRLTAPERAQWREGFEQLKHEMTETAPEGVTCNLTIEEVDLP